MASSSSQAHGSQQDASETLPGATLSSIPEDLRKNIPIPVADKPGFTYLGPMGDPDPVDLINQETDRVPFKHASMEFFYGSWLGWTERFPEAKVYVGLPAPPDAASDGWVETKAVDMEVMLLVQDTPNYGGVMLWNRYYDRRDRYGLRIKVMV